MQKCAQPFLLSLVETSTFVKYEIQYMSHNATLIMNARQIEQRINRLAWQILEHCNEEGSIVIAGIDKNGIVIAARIAKILKEISQLDIVVCSVKLGKDAPLEQPAVISIPSDQLRDKTVIVVDDVSNSGRTLMYSVKAFLNQPVKGILTCVLVDRDHTRFPVKTNFVGLSLATTMQEHIRVELPENGDASVFLE